MFGLEDDKEKKGELAFELEEELNDNAKRIALKKKVEGHIQEIKAILRSDKNKEHFDQFGILLHGYTSVEKVIERFTPK